MNAIRHLFWDFDGTLYDSYPQMLHSLMQGLKELGYADRFSEEEVLGWIKVNMLYGIELCAQRLGISPKTILDAYMPYHLQEKDFTPYAGLASCLKKLHEAGYTHYLYSHRDRGAVIQLTSDGLWNLFADAVIKEDGFPAKPAPNALLALMERNHLSPDQCAMIGDRDIDIDAGHNAGMSGFLFDPEGFYVGYPSELQAVTLDELTQKLLG